MGATNRYEAAGPWVLHATPQPAPFSESREDRWVWFTRAARRTSDLPLRVALQLGTSPVGQLVATAVYVEHQWDEPLTRDDLKTLPLQHFLDLAAEHRVTEVLDAPTAETSRRLGGSHPGRAGYERRDFERFARDYPTALALAGSKNKAIKLLAPRYGRDPSTLYRWVARCQREGLLDREGDA